MGILPGLDEEFSDVQFWFRLVRADFPLAVQPPDLSTSSVNCSKDSFPFFSENEKKTLYFLPWP
jgi:hypothetical protein